MPATPNKLTIDTNGVAVTVDILDVYSQSQTTYTASGGGTSHTLPLAISSPTEFYLTDSGVFTVSAKFAGVEIANTSITVGAGVPATYKLQPVTSANVASLLADRANIATSPTTYTQTYSTAASTVPAATVVAVATTAAGLTSYGYAQAQADAIPVAINALADDVLALKKVITRIIDDLQACGLAG